MACTNSLGQLRFLGEMKTPCVRESICNVDAYKEPLGQISKYMHMDTNLRYGFISTYDQTVFLRQKYVLGQWEL
jgi:hypothetical protein